MDAFELPERSPVSFMGRHFVALRCEYESLNNDGSVFHSGSAVFSGFIIEAGGRWYWVTAGHCLKEELDDRIERRELRIVGGGFADYLGIGAKHFRPYPYTYSVGDGASLYRPELGLDYALIPLNSLMQQAFLANEIVPIGRDNWIHQPGLTFDFYRMLGIPRCRVVTSRRADGGEDLFIGLALLAVNRFSDAEVEALDDAPPNQFIGQIDPAVEIDTIKGMSGGPIYGFRFNSEGEMLYHAVAIQSSWNPNTRTIYACPLPEFAEAVHQCLPLDD